MNWIRRVHRALKMELREHKSSFRVYTVLRLITIGNLLNKSDKLTFSLSPVFTAIVAFCFSMTIGGVWEVFEFAMD